MPHAALVYWCPGVLRPEELADAALRARLTSGAGHRQRNRKGPGEGLGMLYSRTPGTVAYLPERQTWHQFDGGNWLGVDRDFAPAAVVRERTLPGVSLALGRWDWRLPVVNPEVPECSLPLVPWPVNGVWLQRVRREHEALAGLARHLVGLYRAAMFDGTATFSVEADTVYRFLADVVAVNYDLTLTELLALEVFDAASCEQALHLATGWSQVLRQTAERMEASDGEPA